MQTDDAELESNLRKLSLAKLKKRCKSLKVASGGSKSDMIKRIMDKVRISSPAYYDFVPISKLQQTSHAPKRPDFIVNNRNKLNVASFYSKNAPLQDIAVANLFHGCDSEALWSQTLKSHNTTYEELLSVSFTGMIPTIKLPTNEKTNKELFTKSQRIYQQVIRELLVPYLDVSSIVDIILLCNGAHILPIRYSVDLLPYFQNTVREKRSRVMLWQNANKDTKSGDCTVDFIPKPDIIVVEDIYDEFVAHIRKKLGLRNQYEEEAIFYIPNGKVFMHIDAGESHSYHQIVDTIAIKSGFTRLYMNALCNFQHCTEYAFRMDLGGINYRYYRRKERTPSFSWGSRSRCWDGAGLVLLSDGSKKPVKELQVGDEVAVLDRLPNGVMNGCTTARVKVRIESIVNRKYEMVLVNERLWITPYHAVINTNTNKWLMPSNLGTIKERYVESIYNFILDAGHVLCVDDVWGCSLGHDLCGEIIENPIWGSSHVMHQMWSKKRGYPNVVEYI